MDEPIFWEGDLDDDCTARWNGLILRAEWMDGKLWWWAVSKDNNNPLDEIDSSNNYNHKCIGGNFAREMAKKCARTYVQNIVDKGGL